ncbi:MAG TPA: hypothetical protein VIA06_16145 [Candidatus Dormibacteraeota bacterium]|nr:hypothetical protein [Candidatus Dormibacteraeota bacterium]
MGAAADGPGWSDRHGVELYVRTYSTMLQSSGWIRLESLTHVHLGMASSLHSLAASPTMDMGALLYSVQRLPKEIARATRIVLGQSPHRFRAVLGEDVDSWIRVKAPARRRPWFWNGEDTLAVFLSSPSDIDDLVPTLVAYQIEWNKLHRALQSISLESERVREAAGASEGDWQRLREAWGPDFEPMLGRIRNTECSLSLRMVGGSHVGFARNAGRWWQPIQSAIDEMCLTDAPVYFVSSNVHSLVNVLSGVALYFEAEILSHTADSDGEMMDELRKLESGRTPASRENWLYFAARGMFDSHPEAHRLRRQRRELEADLGIRHVQPEPGGVDSAAQIIKLSRLDPNRLDPRIGPVDPLALKASEAYVLNIDYPLGLAAYHLLRQVAESVPWVEGVYVMGKAATLNGQVGDVMIANAVYNEHSGNTYWLDNCFSAADVTDHLSFGSVLDNQRAVTVRGTFLQNRDYLEFYYQGRYTVVEMEAGPYLDASYEILESGRHPMNENVSMTGLTLDLGIIHYASDTPYTQARTLGARGLSYRGMDSTYAAAVAVARRILSREGALLEER